jgi:hypothetical protein
VQQPPTWKRVLDLPHVCRIGTRKAINRGLQCRQVEREDRQCRYARPRDGRLHLKVPDEAREPVGCRLVAMRCCSHVRLSQKDGPQCNPRTDPDVATSGPVLADPGSYASPSWAHPPSQTRNRSRYYGLHGNTVLPTVNGSCPKLHVLRNYPRLQAHRNQRSPEARHLSL